VLDLIENRNGVLLAVKARPQAGRTAIVGQHGGALKIAVAAAPEKGKANRAIVDLLADSLALHKSAIEIVKGETSSDKRIRIAGVTAAELRQRLQRWLSSDGE
jgi:uncharacterized protein (TIGR00251 family)